MICIPTLQVHSNLSHRSIYSFLLQLKPLHLPGFCAANSVPSSIRQVPHPFIPFDMSRQRVFSSYLLVCEFSTCLRVWRASLPGVRTFLSYPNINTTRYTS
ncbi:BA75_01991T0 [Komagataella pastoris]|uniref:BA75_01991T0 n=1 Tax=Komagataella pastoris TaxID=4922 RepID=A0A1B2JBJ5_PICPA|nr:BA75_01991T0 [Komagataella pastoris]